jgi:hypothetical protein
LFLDRIINFKNHFKKEKKTQILGKSRFLFFFKV